MGTAERRVLGLFIVVALLPLETQAVEISQDVAMSVLLGIAAFYFALTTLCMVLVCCACYFNHRPYIVKPGDDQKPLIGREQCEKQVSPNLPDVKVTKELKPSFPVKAKDVIPPPRHPSTTVGDKTSDSPNWTQHKSTETDRPQTMSTHLGPTSRDSPLLPTYLQRPSSATSSPHSRRDAEQHKGHIVPAHRDSPYLQRPSSATSSPHGIRKMPNVRQKSPRMEGGRLSKDSLYLQRPSSGTSTPHEIRKIPIIGDAPQHKGHVVPAHRDSPRLLRDSPYLQRPSSATSSPHSRRDAPPKGHHKGHVVPAHRDSPYLQRPSSATPSPHGIRKIPDMIQKSPRMRRKAEGHVALAPTLSMESFRSSPRVSASDLAKSNVPPEIVFRGVSNPIYEPMEEGAPTVLSLNKELSGISDKWFIIGMRLKVPVKKLNTIRQIHNSSMEKCLMTMFEEWIRMGSPSWTTIVEVLETRLINEIVLAKTIKTKYCPDESTTETETETEFYTMIN